MIIIIIYKSYKFQTKIELSCCSLTYEKLVPRSFVELFNREKINEPLLELMKLKRIGEKDQVRKKRIHYVIKLLIAIQSVYHKIR